MFSSSFSLTGTDWLSNVDDSHYNLPGLQWDSPSLIVTDVLKAVQLYEKIYGFQRVFILPDETNRITFARMRYRGTYFTISHDEAMNRGDRPLSHSESSSKQPFYLYVDDVDSVFVKAMVNGCYVLESPHVDFIGDYKARLLDIFGYVWDIASKI